MSVGYIQDILFIIANIPFILAKGILLLLLSYFSRIWKQLEQYQINLDKLKTAYDIFREVLKKSI